MTTTLTYHNTNHINIMLARAEKYFKSLMPPDEYDWLIRAIKMHDEIYDEKQNKEFRSAELMVSEMIARGIPRDDPKLTQASDAIYPGTANHMFLAGNKIANYLILLDLWDLTIPRQVEINWWLILQESVLLYDVTPLEAAKASGRFMTDMKSRWATNMRMVFQTHKGSFSELENFHREIDAISKGIDHTIELSASYVRRG